MVWYMDGFAANHLNDIDLAAAVAAAMQADPHVPADVTVDVSNGIVTLEGEVGTSAERKAAESLAKRFVASVINAITVKPHARADSAGG
jgi:osmotically-inducible protein OsmY